MAESGELDRLRGSQAVSQLEDEIRASLFARASNNQRFAAKRRSLEAAVAQHAVPVSTASRQLVDLLWPDDHEKPTDLSTIN